MKPQDSQDYAERIDILAAKFMPFFRFMLKCALALILAVALYCVAGNKVAHFLFRTIYSGLDYPLPESIATAFGLMLALVVVVYRLWQWRKGSRN